MTWTSPAVDVPDGPMTGSDRDILIPYLEAQRHSLLNICAGLTAEQLSGRALPPSRLSLQGLVRHAAKVERIWFRIRSAGEDVPNLYGGPGDPTDFEDLDPARAADEVDQLRSEWELCRDAVRTLPLDLEFLWRGEPMSLRMVYVHVIGEYSRHNGHADLLRESIDGVTGR
ncbi:DinB family protein [Rhodococcus sp. G-MC3]|uniref:DinB family protein n=1 Tax=Rhodococcus sp. G-MC3 TaxID=3046209 RepID=UPI0024BA97C7|nr:DinB family protein [Rhodococcus sp. G-MC3]MDJ0395590.1 DinB family protein [Rhodococcus sp. G-MC3]